MEPTMKKILVISTALYMLTTLPGGAQIIIQPTLFAPPPPVIIAPAPAYYVVEPAPYPVRIEPHHHYDYRYWHEHNAHHDARDEHRH
jgi:hypothetical protein